MSLTTSAITGRIPLPTNVPATRVEVTFTLTGYDTQGENVVPGGAQAKFVAEPDGTLPPGASLWRNTQGLRGTVYHVGVTWQEGSRRDYGEKYADLGYVQVGDNPSYTLPELLANPAQPQPGWYETVPAEVWQDILGLSGQVSDLADQTSQNTAAIAGKAEQSALDGEAQARAEDVDRLTNDLVGKADARETDFPGVSWAVTLTYADGNNYRSWLEANDIDGGPSDWSAGMMTDALRRNKAIAREVSFPGVSYGVVLRHEDDDDYRSWIEVNDEDGGPSEFALSILRERLGNIEPARPVDRMTDMGKIASWGASSMMFMRLALQDMADFLDAAYYSGGDGGTTADLSLARMGARPARLSFPGGVIPASGSVNVSCSLRYHTSIDPYPGVVAGVEGVLSAPAGGSFVFERLIPGAAVPVAPDSPFVSTGGAPFADALHIINMGKNDLVSGDGAGLNDPARVMALTREAVDWIPTLNRRCLLLNHYVNRDVAPGAPERQRIADYNDMLAAAYGGVVIDVQSYLLGNDVWTDTGITPTQADLDAQQIGNLPPSLARDAVHLNDAANTAIVNHLIQPRLIALGWYQQGVA